MADPMLVTTGIPPCYLTGEKCHRTHYTDPARQKEHEGHDTILDCYLLTWAPPPMRWVKRVRPPGAPPAYPGDPRTRSWHLAIGIRREDNTIQMDCNIGHGPGPFRWREKPVLDWRKEGEVREWFCRRCVAAWTKEVSEVTVRMQDVSLTRKLLTALLAEMPDADYARVTFRPTSVDDTPALVAMWDTGSRDETVVKYLLVGDGLVKLGYQGEHD